MKPALLVLAAGVGSRYGGLKQLEAVGPHGQTLIDYSVHDALAAGFGKLVFVIRREIEEEFRRTVSGKWEDRVEVRYAHQELEPLPAGFSVPASRAKPWGTAHATLVAAELIAEPFAVINADDFYGASAYTLIRDFFRSSDRSDDPAQAMVGFTLRETLSEHGHVSRGVCRCDTDGMLRRIDERTKIQRRGTGAEYLSADGRAHPLTGDEVVSMNFWGFTPTIFPLLRERFEVFLNRHAADPAAEFQLPTVVAELIARRQVTVAVLRGAGPWLGMTHRDDRRRAAEGIRRLVDRGDYPAEL